MEVWAVGRQRGCAASLACTHDDRRRRYEKAIYEETQQGANGRAGWGEGMRMRQPCIDGDAQSCAVGGRSRRVDWQLPDRMEQHQPISARLIARSGRSSARCTATIGPPQDTIPRMTNCDICGARALRPLTSHIKRTRERHCLAFHIRPRTTREAGAAGPAAAAVPLGALDADPAAAHTNDGTSGATSSDDCTDPNAPR